MSREPHTIAWADQFGALLRDKCRQMQEGLWATGWDHMVHEFSDPSDGDEWRLTFYQGYFWVTNLTQDEDKHVVLNLDSLGVNREW
jgi:hypothetical protein